MSSHMKEDEKGQKSQPVIGVRGTTHGCHDDIEHCNQILLTLLLQVGLNIYWSHSNLGVRIVLRSD